jgi:hypothetical protein
MRRLGEVIMSRLPPRSPGPPSPEHRRHARRDVRMSAEIRTDRAVFTATTRDLSEGGAGLDADRPLVEGEKIALGLFLVIDDLEEQTPPLWVTARVAWAGESDDGRHASGVRFEVITDDQRAWLKQVLAHVGEPAR